jgi:RimJ/RimL family protein N-acetyltransferase
MDLVLRPLVVSDVDWIHAACQDADIQRWTTVPVPYTRADAEHFVATFPGRTWTWAVVDTSTQSPGLAMASIHEIDPITGEADAGYWVAPWARRRGVATWAVGQLAAQARAMPTVGSIALIIAADNVASRRTAEAAGFTLDPDAVEEAPDRRDLDRPWSDQLVTAVRYRLVLAGS